MRQYFPVYRPKRKAFPVRYRYVVYSTTLAASQERCAHPKSKRFTFETWAEAEETRRWYAAQVPAEEFIIVNTTSDDDNLDHA